MYIELSKRFRKLIAYGCVSLHNAFITDVTRGANGIDIHSHQSENIAKRGSILRNKTRLRSNAMMLNSRQVI